MTETDDIRQLQYERYRVNAKPRSIDELVEALRVGEGVRFELEKEWVVSKAPHVWEELQRISERSAGIYYALGIDIGTGEERMMRTGSEEYLRSFREWHARPENRFKNKEEVTRIPTIEELAADQGRGRPGYDGPPVT